jgi:hypothetical protein
MCEMPPKPATSGLSHPSNKSGMLRLEMLLLNALVMMLLLGLIMLLMLIICGIN